MASVERQGNDDIKKRLNKTFENRLDLDRVGIIIRVSLNSRAQFAVCMYICSIGNSGCTHRSIDLLYGEYIVGSTKFT